MMQSVVLDGNPLDEDDGNLLNEVVLDVNLMFYKKGRSTRKINISMCKNNDEKCVS